MAKFVFVYHGGKMPETPEEGERVMGLWMSWLGGMGEAVVDGGNPVGMSTTVYADRVDSNGGSNPISGYSLVSADSMDEAVKMAQGCPILAEGGSVEVAEAFDM